MRYAPRGADHQNGYAGSLDELVSHASQKELADTGTAVS